MFKRQNQIVNIFKLNYNTQEMILIWPHIDELIKNIQKK